MCCNYFLCICGCLPSDSYSRCFECDTMALRMVLHVSGFLSPNQPLYILQLVWSVTMSCDWTTPDSTQYRYTGVSFLQTPSTMSKVNEGGAEKKVVWMSWWHFIYIKQKLVKIEIKSITIAITMFGKICW